MEDSSPAENPNPGVPATTGVDPLTVPSRLSVGRLLSGLGAGVAALTLVWMAYMTFPSKAASPVADRAKPPQLVVKKDTAEDDSPVTAEFCRAHAWEGATKDALNCSLNVKECGQHVVLQAPRSIVLYVEPLLRAWLQNRAQTPPAWLCSNQSVKA